METLAELTNRKIVPEAARVNRPTMRRLDSVTAARDTQPEYAAYESAVFNYLFENKGTLGVSGVWKCGSLRVDGLLDLEDGRRLVLEIKYRINWHKACQANWQFDWYLKHPESEKTPVNGALVVFEEFSGDWWKRAPSRLLQNGWNYWYTEHCKVADLPVDLVRFRDGTLETYTSALASARSAASGSSP